MCRVHGREACPSFSAVPQVWMLTRRPNKIACGSIVWTRNIRGHSCGWRLGEAQGGRSMRSVIRGVSEIHGTSTYAYRRGMICGPPWVGCTGNTIGQGVSSVSQWRSRWSLANLHSWRYLYSWRCCYRRIEWGSRSWGSRGEQWSALWRRQIACACSRILLAYRAECSPCSEPGINTHCMEFCKINKN